MSPKKSLLVDDIDDIEDIDEAADETPVGLRERITERVRTRSARPPSPWSGRIGAAVLAVFLVASLSVLGWLYWFSYRPDSAVDADAAKAAITAASDGTVAVLSYAPDTIERDFSTARSHLTGEFLTYYDNFTKQIVGPATQQKSLKTTAVVLRAALTEFQPNSAKVLLFINQSTLSKDRPEPTMTSSSVLVTLTKADGKWLISQFNPA